MFVLLALFLLLVHGDVPMLNFVPGLHDSPVETLSPNGVYEHNIDHVDIYGGRTIHRSTLRMNQDRFVVFDDAATSGANSAAERGWSLESCTHDDVYVRVDTELGRAPFFGAVLSGRAIKPCCKMAAEQHKRNAGMQASNSDANDNMLSMHSLCAREVVEVTIVREEEKVGTALYRCKVKDVDVMALIDHLAIQFSHTPGNKSDEEALAEHRKRSGKRSELAFIDIQKDKKFDGFKWNYDEEKDTAKSKDIKLPITYNGKGATCKTCFFAFVATMQFDLLVTRGFWGMPKIELVRFLFGGDLNLGVSLEVPIPFTLKLFGISKELVPRLDLANFVLPAGPFGVTIKPNFGPVLNLGVQATASVVVSHGGQYRVKATFGFHWAKGQILPDFVSDVESKTKLVDSTVGGFGVSPITDKKMSLTIGIKVQIAVNVGLNFIALAYVPWVPGPEFFEVSFGVGPMVGVSAKYHNDLDCLGYEFVRGINMGTTISVLFFKLGGWKIGFDSFLGFPFENIIPIIAPKVPPGCDQCRGCIPGTGLLPSWAQTAIEAAAKNPEMAMPIQFKTLKNITLAVSGATTFAAGQLLKITFETPAQTKKISLAFERRRKDDKVEDEEDRFPTYTGMVTEDVDVPLTLLNGALNGRSNSAMIGMRAVAPDMKSGDLIRVFAYDNDDETVFGRASNWLVWAPTNNTKLDNYWIYDSFEDCIKDCGPENVTRSAWCINTNGAQLDNSKCNITQRMDLIRDCKNPTCEFVPISIMYPQEDFGADDNGDVEIKVLANGGFSGRAMNVDLCVDDKSSVTCSILPPKEEFKCVKLGNAMPGKESKFKINLQSLKLPRQTLRTLAVNARVAVKLANDTTNQATTWSQSFVISSQRHYKLEPPKDVDAPKEWMAFGSAGTASQNDDNQRDIGEVLYVWVPIEYAKAHATGTRLKISADSGGGILGIGDSKPFADEYLDLTFSAKTGTATCFPNDGKNQTKCLGEWEGLAWPLNACPSPPDSLIDDPSNNTSSSLAVSLTLNSICKILIAIGILFVQQK